MPDLLKGDICSCTRTLKLSTILKSIFFFLLLFNSLSGTSVNNPNQKTKIVFRFDDYILKSDIISDSLIYVFNKNKIPLCIGLIPFNTKGLLYNDLNQEQLNTLKEKIRKKEVEIALHGFNHVDNKLISGSLLKKSGPSEFAGLNFRDQYTKIKKGKTTLDSLLNININIFIPPFNSYDNNTLRALDSLNFEVISAGSNGFSSPGKINYIPFTTSVLTELPEIIKSSRYDNSTIVVVLHLYSFAGEYAGKIPKPVYISQLDTMLGWINGQTNVVVSDFSTLADSEIFDNNRFVLNSLNKNLLINILNNLKIYRYGVYNTAEYLENHKRIFSLFNILFHLIVFVSVFFAAKIFSKMAKSCKMLRITFLALFIIMIMSVLYKAINSHGFIAYVVFLATISLAICIGIIKGNYIPEKSGN